MSNTKNRFSQFALNKNILSAIADLGYESATPIQEQGIPVLLSGKDLLAQAQTGTGKTATFALPILSNIDLSIKAPQALIIAPTRELAIQVAEAFQSYAKYLKGFSVAPIYGGQDFGTQLRLIKRGSHVIVGTPGRLMDHLRRGTLPVDSIKAVVLDEADEMLKMGFVEDVEWILSQLTGPHQTALFSATVPASIQKISHRYLKDAVKIHIKAQTNTVDTISQSYITVTNRNQKLEVLTRLLEAEENQGVIIFTRTKTESAELAERLLARGYRAAALNGDMSQASREKTIARLKNSTLDIVVATDVAARGIDVERITHVINYDIPYDVDSYIHRIGRTGRAGREGRAILFVTPREQRLLRDIEHHIKKSIKRMEPPSLKEIQEKQASQLGEKIVKVVREQRSQLKHYYELIDSLSDAHLSEKEIAAALMYLAGQPTAPTDIQLESNAESGKGEWKHQRKRSSNAYGAKSGEWSHKNKRSSSAEGVESREWAHKHKRSSFDVGNGNDSGDWKRKNTRPSSHSKSGESKDWKRTSKRASNSDSPRDRGDRNKAKWRRE